MRTITRSISRWLSTKIVFALLLCSVASLAFAEDSNGFKNNYKYTKKRTIDANFNAGEGYVLSLYGKYCDYEISTWNESHIGFHVEIVTKSNKEEKAENLLRQIDIEFENYKSDKKVVAKTIIPNKINNIEFQIDYYIMIPHHIVLSIDNSYGDISIDKLSRHLNLDLDYGNLSIDSLSTDNKIDVTYGNIKIKHAEKVDAKIAYGNIRINTGNEINVNLKYGDAKFGNIKSLKCNSQYSDISCSDIDNAYLKIQYSDTYLKNVKALTIDGTYSDVEIDYLLKNFSFTSSYGDIEINKVSHDFELIDIKTTYSDANIIFSENHKFSYNISALHADVECDFLEDTAIKYIKKDDETKIIGHYNGCNDSHHVRIDMQYGDLEFGLRNE